MTDDEDHMVKISALISRLQSTMDQFGDTCVYIRRGGLSWGAVALNRRSDDQKHGVFDLQAQHDRDMIQRAEQVERLIASRRSAEERLASAAKALELIEYASRKDSLTDHERLQDVRHVVCAALSRVNGDVGGAR